MLVDVTLDHLSLSLIGNKSQEIKLDLRFMRKLLASYYFFSKESQLSVIIKALERCVMANSISDSAVVSIYKAKVPQTQNTPSDGWDGPTF